MLYYIITQYLSQNFRGMAAGRRRIVLLETEDKEIKLSVQVEYETVWLNRNQIAELFDRDVKTIGKCQIKAMLR